MPEMQQLIDDDYVNMRRFHRGRIHLHYGVKDMNRRKQKRKYNQNHSNLKSQVEYWMIHKLNPTNRREVTRHSKMSPKSVFSLKSQKSRASSVKVKLNIGRRGSISSQKRRHRQILTHQHTRQVNNGNTTVRSNFSRGSSKRISLGISNKHKVTNPFLNLNTSRVSSLDKTKSVDFNSSLNVFSHRRLNRSRHLKENYTKGNSISSILDSQSSKFIINTGNKSNLLSKPLGLHSFGKEDNISKNVHIKPKTRYSYTPHRHRTSSMKNSLFDTHQKQREVSIRSQHSQDSKGSRYSSKRISLNIGQNSLSKRSRIYPKMKEFQLSTPQRSPSLHKVSQLSISSENIRGNLSRPSIHAISKNSSRSVSRKIKLRINSRSLIPGKGHTLNQINNRKARNSRNRFSINLSNSQLQQSYSNLNLSATDRSFIQPKRERIRHVGYKEKVLERFNSFGKNKNKLLNEANVFKNPSQKMENESRKSE